jgi:hypothetical protein
LYLTVHQCDPDGSGTANLNLIPKREKICYTLTVKQHRSCYRCAHTPHIHKARAGENGSIVKALRAPDVNGSSEGCARLSRMKIKMIKNNPSGYYVNVHNADFPNGAVRGQLHN